MACVAPGFGTGAWGKTPWGGSLVAAAGGPIPVVAPFDIYCVGPCGPIASLLTYNEVSTVGDPTAFPVDGFTMDQELCSGGSFPTTDAEFSIGVSVPENFTFEFTALFQDLPPNFSDLINQHAYFGTSSSSGGCAGLFFSQIGLAYTGSVHLDGSNSIVLDTPVQDLPGSQVLVSENEYWTIRIAVSMATGTTYIYVTKTAELLVIGHQLRYILPAIPSSSAAVVPPNETQVSVRGTLSAPSILSLNSICLGTGLIIPVIIPKADAGPDQALRLCSVLQLDGSRSYDPQGAALLYKWQLIDAPLGSQYIFDEVDGFTQPLMVPTGFTDHIYSESLSVLNSVNTILSGDVLIVGGTVYTIVGTGTDGTGFFARVDGYVLPDNLPSSTAFKYILQNGLNTATLVRPTFYPDIPGIFKFSLIVFNGSLFSEPSETITNVVESVVARGCTPDLSFVWNYLSDFWGLVEDTERITTFWQGLAQVAAAELLNLWQADYSKSLRDIQRTFQRRWMHYDLLMQESAALTELSTVRAIFGGLDSVALATSGVSGIAGTHLDLQLDTTSAPVVVSLGGVDPYTPAMLQAALQAGLSLYDTRIVVRLIPNRAGTSARVRIDAPFGLSVLNTSTCPAYVVGHKNSTLSGTAGSGVVTSRTYRVGRSLQYLDIKPNDFLCIAGVAYRIARVIDHPSDPFLFQRITLVDPVPLPAGATWSIVGAVTSPDLDFWSGLCEVGDQVIYEVLDQTTRTLVDVMGSVMGSCQALPGSLPADATMVGLYLIQPTRYSVFLKGVLRRRYVPIDPLVVDVPLLQEFIVAADDTQVLRRNVDYFLSTFREQPCIQFVTPVPATAGGPDVWQGVAPPERLWAETSYLDNRPRIESNFGIPAGFTLDDLSQLPSNVDYLSAVQGLWFSYWSGPTLFNLRVGAQILLGLPFAEQAGTIIELRDDFSSTIGRILVQDTADAAIVREYTFPAALAIELNPATGKAYAVGDTVTQFAPLVQGVEVDDWVKNPTWFQGYLEQGSFFEVEKFFKFLVRVESPAFNLSALLFVQSFIKKIKPTYTYALFVVLASVGDTDVSTSDLIELHGNLLIFDGACFDGTIGVATMFDQGSTAYGGWRSQFDHNANRATPPTYPTPNYPIVWGFDKNYLCPEDVIVGTACTTFAGPTLPPFDSIFAFDLPVYTLEAAQFAEGALAEIPALPTGLPVGLPQTIASSGTLHEVSIEIQASGIDTPNTYHLILVKNGGPGATIPFTLTPGGFSFTSVLALSVVMGDVLTCFIHSTGTDVVQVAWSSLLVTVGQAVAWAYDTTLSAGTYCVYRAF